MDIESLQELDYKYSHKIAHSLSHDGIPRKLIQIATQTGTAIVWSIGLVLVFLIFPEFRPESFSLLVTTLVMTIPVFILKETIRRERPEFKDVRMGAVAFDKWSFPSGHATRATYVMILMSIYMPNFSIFWYLWGSLMIVSRLLLGVHYISDILAGVILSATLISIFLWLGFLPIVPFYSLVPTLIPIF